MPLGRWIMCVKNLWILSAITIVNITAIIAVIRWVMRMIIEKKCKKIINDFNNKYGRSGLIPKLDLKPTLIKEYKISNWKANRCIDYLKKNGYLISIRDDATTWGWISQ
jgi:hypothetical protein